jgi:ADP-heptose:LPS heptosyltransferase
MAILDNLDLLVTVDTSVAHLAGAMGRPAWIMLPRAPDWRWLLDRADTPWYPTVRLFRQTKARRWDDVAEAIAAELAARNWSDPQISPRR